MDKAALHRRHRNNEAEIAQKHGDIRVRPLRRRYGVDFAPGFANDEKLQDVLAALDEHSLSELVRDHEHGELEGRIAEARTGTIVT
jgi:hypothetical protein